jgi:hypothetical protein
MTRENKNKLNEIILQTILNTHPVDLYMHCGCRSAHFGVNGYSITFYKRQVARYLHKKLGFPVSINQIAQALKPIQKSNYYEISRPK